MFSSSKFSKPWNNADNRHMTEIFQNGIRWLAAPPLRYQHSPSLHITEILAARFLHLQSWILTTKAILSLETSVNSEATIQHNIQEESYVYWTVHHLDSWIKRDQLDVTCFFISLFNAQHVSDVNTSILRSFSLHPDTTPHQPNHNVTPTRIEPDQYNPWNNSTNKSQAPEDGCINIRNMLSIK